MPLVALTARPDQARSTRGYRAILVVAVALILITLAPVARAATPTQIAVGRAHTCAIVNGGEVVCWGYNEYGQLGNGTIDNSLTPVAVVGIADADSLALGQSHSCARLRSGSVRCWGLNEYGQLGNGSTTDSSVPVAAVGVSNATSVAAGDNHSCSRIIGGRIRCWGANGSGGQVSGDPGFPAGDAVSTPMLVVDGASRVTLENATAVTASGAGTCATFTNNETRCWGYGWWVRPVWQAPDTPMLGAQQVSGDCATFASGAVRCWGRNNYGQHGNGTTAGFPDWLRTSAAVSGITSAVEVSSSGWGACARLADGALRCWGLGTTGQLGDGAAENRSTPVGVVGITNATSVAAGIGHTCALLADGTARCWGYNEFGQLGDGTTTNRLTPVLVSVLAAGGGGGGGDNGGGGDVKPRPATPRNITWRLPKAAKRPVTARFRATKGVRYRIAVTRAGGKKPLVRRGTCRTQKQVVRCQVRVPTKGRWRATITPIKDGVQGKPAARSFRIR